MPEFPNFPLEKFTVKFITMHSARGHSFKACELALAQLASKRFPLELVTTHRFGLKDVDLAIRSVGSPGAEGSTRVTGREGKTGWACAAAARSRPKTSAVARGSPIGVS